jgi:hypothetical protein
VLVRIAGVVLSLAPLLVPAVALVSKLNSTFSLVLRTTSAISRAIGAIKIGPIFSILQKTFLFFGKATSFIGKFGGVFAKFLGPLGLVIAAFQLISSSIKHIRAFLRGEISIGQALGNIVYDVLLKPFIDAWNWIRGIFVGKSPSELALGIVKGLMSVQGMMLNALTYPFRKAWSWISGNPAPALFSSTPQTPEASLSGGTKAEQGKAVEAAESPAQKTLTDILNAVQTLNKNLEAGKIAVHVDGQLVSATLARQTAFKGGFGMNVV